MDELRRRLRLAYVEGAEAWALENDGRRLTEHELGRVIDGYEGDRRVHLHGRRTPRLVPKG
jgi:hypothetical protein